jgi:hypothetical protein
VAEVCVHDHAKLFEFFEISIDGREMDIRCSQLHGACELLGGAMFATVEEHFEEGATRACGAPSRRANEIENRFDRRKLLVMSVLHSVRGAHRLRLPPR